MFRKVNIKNSVLLIVANDPGTGCAKKCKWLGRINNTLPTNLLRQKRIMMADLSREETIAAFRSADLFLFPSRS